MSFHICRHSAEKSLTKMTEIDRSTSRNTRRANVLWKDVARTYLDEAKKIDKSGNAPELF